MGPDTSKMKWFGIIMKGFPTIIKKITKYSLYSLQLAGLSQLKWERVIRHHGRHLHKQILPTMTRRGMQIGRSPIAHLSNAQVVPPAGCKVKRSFTCTGELCSPCVS